MRKELRSDFTTRQTMLSDSFELYYYSDVTIKPVDMHSHSYYEFYIFLEGDVDMQIENVDNIAYNASTSASSSNNTDNTSSSATSSDNTVKLSQSASSSNNNVNLSPSASSSNNLLQFSLTKGDVIVFPPGIRHHAIKRSCASSAKNSPSLQVPYRRFVFWISEKYLKELINISSDYSYLTNEALKHNYIHHLEPALLGEVLSRAITVLEEINNLHYGHDSFLRLYSSELFLTLTRYVYESEHKIKVNDSTNMMGQLLTYIDEHLTDTLSLDILADNFYVSKSYIVHEFKNRLGLSVHRYIIKKRLAGCRDLMLSGTPISEAYITYGFNDYSNFYKAFRKEYGYSPREYVDIHTMPGLNQ